MRCAQLRLFVCVRTWQIYGLPECTAKIADEVTSSARAPGAIVRKAKSFVIAQRVPMSSPATFAVLDLLVLLDQAKSTRKESVRKNFPINFSGIIPSQCLGDFLRGATLPPFVTKRWRQKCPQGTSVGIGRRFSLSGHKRLRCFARPLRALEPPSDLIPPPVQCGICGALRATMIICWSPVLTGLRPAGSHCESSG